jgi:hypothetical protein
VVDCLLSKCEALSSTQVLGRKEERKEGREGGREGGRKEAGRKGGRRKRKGKVRKERKRTPLFLEA